MESLSRKKRILVLDNGSRMLSMVDEISCYFDYDIHIIYDVNAIYDKAKLLKPDMIILDYLMLNDDCELTCRDLKQDNELKDIPVIIITVYRSRKVRSDSYKCDALFLKPMDMDVLASRIDYLMAS